jgi:hypothetical protein
MSTNSPTKTPEAVLDKPAEEKPAKPKFDPFHPEMPQIPGVTGASGRSRTGSGRGSAFDRQRLLQFGGGGAAALLVVGLIAWWAMSKSSKPAGVSPNPELADQSTPAPPPPSIPPPAIKGPTVAATLEEVSKPWSSKKFTFVNPITQQHIPAMVIRLPGGGLWAFSLQNLGGRCDLDFVTDTAELTSKYAYRASHPMVVSPCDGTVYDPLKIGSIGGNTWVRGEIVQGSSLRPPISIDVKVSGRSVIADSIE